jgi:hypothetical protein
VSLQLETPAEVRRAAVDTSRRAGVRIAAVASALIAGAVLGFAVSAPAPGVTGDSFFYLAGAHSLVTNQKLEYPDWRWTVADSVQPMIRTTPGLSLALAAFMSLGVSPLGAARIVQSVSAAAIVGLSTLIVGAFSGPVVGALAGLSILALPAFHDVHLYVFTEPLFLAGILCGLWALCIRNRSALAGAFFLVGAVTRYVGVSVAGGAGLAGLLFPGTLSTKALRFAKIVGPSLVFFVAWRLWTASPNDPQAIRVRGLFPLDQELTRALASAEQWLIPGSRPGVRLLLVVLIGACILAVLFAPRVRAASPFGPSEGLSQPVGHRVLADRRMAVLTLGIMALSYAGFVVLARFLAEPTIAFGDRMLLPIYVLIHLLIAITLPHRIRELRVARAFAGLAVGLWLTLSLRVSLVRIVTERRIGLDIAGSDVRTSPTLQWLSIHVRQRSVYSNNPLPIYHHARRAAKFWPQKLPVDSADAFVRRVQATHGLVVAFERPDPFVPVATLEQLSTVVPLRTVASFPDGAVLELAGRTTGGSP